MTTPLTFVHISDTHISPDLTYTRPYMGPSNPTLGAKALVRAVNALPFAPDFILHTGDVAYDPEPEAYETAREVFADLDAPVYYLAGNHDNSRLLQTGLLDRKADEVVRPLHYEIAVNGMQIACVDSNGPAQAPLGNMTPEQLAWLEDICTADDARPLIIATHHNPLSMGVACPWLESYMGITNGDDFHRVVVKAGKRLRGVFHGHVHQNMEVMRDGVLYSACLSSWGQLHAYEGLADTAPDVGARPGFSVVTVTAQQTFIRRYWFDLDD